jgi:energy-coupling factor transport system permease protein
VELGAVRQLSPLLAGSLERGLNLAEAMEARGYGRADRTRAPRPGWSWLDYAALSGAVLVVVAGAWWL